MISYPFIEDLFKNILSKSKAMKGRFFVCPRMGREIGSDELGQVIQDLFAGSKLERKVPLTLMTPPVSTGDFTAKTGEWEDYRFMLFFLTTSYYSGTNQTVNPNPNTRTSTHTISQDWHDMKRCAVNFIYVLNQVMRTNQLFNKSFRLEQNAKRIITPVSLIGLDRLSGVRLDFNASLFNGCAIEDYTQGDISTIEIPADDSHPEHQL